MTEKEKLEKLFRSYSDNYFEAMCACSEFEWALKTYLKANVSSGSSEEQTKIEKLSLGRALHYKNGFENMVWFDKVDNKINPARIDLAHKVGDIAQAVFCGKISYASLSKETVELKEFAAEVNAITCELLEL